MYPSTQKKLLRGLAITLFAMIALLAGYIAMQPYERWRAYQARLEPFSIDQPVALVSPALRAAAERIGGWHYVGDAGDGNRIQVLFTREVRLPIGVDDITVTLLSHEGTTVVSARSRSRKTWADFGRNRRNLARLQVELAAVMERTTAP